MNNISLKRLFHYCYKKRKLIYLAASMIAICFVAFGIRGAIKSKADIDRKKEQYNEKLTKYEKTIQEYDAALSELQDSVEIALEQISALQEYCDNSIYMNLDSQKIAVANIQYLVKNTEIPGNILNSLTSYINDGCLKQEIASTIQSIPVEYLDEIISCNINGSTLNVSVMHYNEEQAEKIMSILEECLIVRCQDIFSNFGTFSFEKMNYSVSAKMDISVMNMQNTQLSNLKNFKSNYADLSKKLIVQENDRQTYIDVNNPGSFQETNYVRIVLYCGILGLLLGFFIPVFLIWLRLIVDDRVISGEELRCIGLSVIGFIAEKNKEKCMESSIEGLSLLMQKNQMKNIFFNVEEDESDVNAFEKEYIEAIREKGFHVTVGKSIINDVHELKKMITADNCILFVRLGKTTYAKIEAQVSLCQKFGISVVESIVID